MFQAISGEVAGIFAKCKDAVVRIQAVDCYGMTAGTGFFIDPNGTIYTNYSVVGRSWNVTVEFADKRYPAHLLMADPRSGVTMLKIEAGLDAVPAGGQRRTNSKSPRPSWRLVTRWICRNRRRSG